MEAIIPMSKLLGINKWWHK